MRSAAVALALAAIACRSSTEHGSRTVDVVANAGTQPAAGVTVLSHSPSGEVVDLLVADAVGEVSIGVDDDSLVSVVFPGTFTNVTPVVSIVTTTAPADGVTLTVDGPIDGGPPPLIVGTLQVDGSPLPAADYFDVDVGCATVRLTKLPDYIDIGACSMGSDTTLDVLVRGYHDAVPSPVLDGYAAGRAQMTNGMAMLSLPAWQTGGTPIPVMFDGITPVVHWTLFADGVPFVDEVLTGNAFAYANLMVDRTVIEASLAGLGFARITDREVAGVPTSIAFSDADFLPAFDRTTEIASTKPLSLRWAAASAPVDAIHLHATWGGATARVVPGSARVVWDAVVPPTSTGVSLPVVDGDLGTVLAGASSLVPDDIVLRQLDSSDLSEFSALQAAGIHAEDVDEVSPIVARPPAGQVRLAQTTGVR